MSLPASANFGAGEVTDVPAKIEVELGIVARHEPAADVPALVVGQRAPRVAVRLSGRRNRAPPPELAARARVVRHDHAGGRATLGLAAAARDDLAVCDDRARRVLCAAPVVEQLDFPRELARACVERVEIIVGARVDQRAGVDREITVDGRHGEIFGEIGRQRAAILPLEVARRGVECLNEIARVRKVHDAVVDERRAFLDAGPERARPHHLQLADIAAVDFDERAVAPQIERAPPHEPVGGIGVLQHRVGDGHESRSSWAAAALAVSSAISNAER